MKKLLYTLLCVALLAGCSKNEGEKGKSSSSKDFVETVSGLDMKIIYVEGGTFMMGATAEQEDEADSDESPVREITLDSFYISETPITQSQWETVMGSTLEEQRNKADSSWSLYGVGPNYPMYYINWDDAQEFCEKLSELTGKKYSLPTEAQWEYAARGGKKSKGYKYSGSDNIDDVAWYSGNSDSETHMVKTKQPNELGLYDMSGNVYEWCQDWYGSEYDESDTNNPTGPSSGSLRVLRGGCWYKDAQNCRVSHRSNNAQSYRSDLNGFRVVVHP